MAYLYTKIEAVAELPYIEDKSLYRAVDLALWLYLDMNWGFKTAINKAAEKHSVKPKKSIETLMRQVIPEEVIWGRMNKPKAKSNVTLPSKKTKGSIISAQKIDNMLKEGKRHIADISTSER